MTTLPPSRPGPRPAPGAIGPYKVLEELGRGGQGIVYLGQDAAGDRVAIKAVADGHDPDSPAARRLRQEGEFLAVLDHPNIAHVYEPVVENGRTYVVMEYVEGQPLSERLRYGPLPRNEGLDICRQVAMAMESAHLARVVHRDLKPANIRVTPDGVVKVLDFGVAAYTGGSGGGAGGVAGAPDGEEMPRLVGTYGYMAPEQMMGGEVDHRADIWAFACILFECLAGHALFPGSNFDEVFLRVACRDADLGRLPADLPRRLREVLRQCLVRHPGGRLGSIGEVTAAIDAVLNRRLAAGRRPADRTNLPRRPNSFVGRERELAEISAALRFSPGLCITGPGGSGKTRLALEAASRLQREFRDGVWFLDLSERSPDESVAGALAGVLPAALLARRPLVPPPGEAPDADDAARLARQLVGAHVLLVVDQCDLFGEAFRRLCAVVGARCPHVRFLLTSREHPEIDGHGVLALRPLQTPVETPGVASAASLMRVESVRLFVERARAVDRAYAPDDAEAAAIARLCRRLEGLPLAVELAGARAGTMGPGQMIERLDSILREPARSLAGARPRHATLDACIRWSVDLLTTAERHILTRLAVFRGGWTLDAAQAVCAGGEPSLHADDVHLLLTRLVNKSLIGYATQSGRYSMLESVKAFAAERLAPYELDALRRRHFAYFLDFARRTARQILGTAQVTGLRALEADLENFNAALDADATGVTPDDRLRLTLAIHRFLYLRGHFHEARRRISDALRSAQDADASLRWQAHNSLGLIAFGLEEFAAAEASYRRALEIVVQTGEQAHAAMLWDNLGVVCTEQGRYDEANAAYVTSLGINERLGDGDAILRVKLNYAYHHIYRRLYDRAEELCNECLVGFRANGDSKREAVALHDLGEIAFYRGRFAEARPFFVQSIRLKDALGDRRGISLTVYMYGLVMLREGYHEHAATLLAKSLEIRAELGIQSLPMPRPEHEAALAELAGTLGAEGFAAAWNRGRELFDEEAVQTVTTTGYETDN